MSGRRRAATEVRDSASARPGWRGDLVTVTLPGDFGKPRPALIVQADQFAATATVTILLVTGTLIDAPLLRVNIRPDADSGLRKPSQVMIDKTMTVRRNRLGSPIGRIDADTLVEVERCLAVFLGIAK